MNLPQATASAARRQSHRTSGGFQTLWGGLACLCFVVQQFLLPVQLLLHEHTFDGFLEVHAHSHETGCDAGADTSREEAQGESHHEAPELADGETPHPVEDHAGETPEPGLEPAWLLIQIALVDLGAAFELRPLPFRELVEASSDTPRGPPFVRTSLRLRAPPFST